MAFDSRPNEAPRKTLDDIRRELEAEFGEVEIPEPVAGRRRAQDWTEREESKDDVEISERHRSAMEPRRPVSQRGARRSGYVIAGLAGCVAGQVVVLPFLLVTVATAPAPTPPQLIIDSQFSPETRSEAESAAVASAPQPSVALPPRVAPEPPAAAPRQTAVVSAVTARDSVPPPLAPETRRVPARAPRVAGAHDVAESQARLRTALGEWFRTSARGGATVQTTEPVIILGPDGRTAKTYVSVVSPIGLIPREQRWELGPRGWSLVDDRQAGLPQPATSRER